MEPFWPASGRPTTQRGRWRGGALSPLTKIFLPKPDYNDPRCRRPDLPPWPREVETAQAKTDQWARFWFEPHEVRAWLDAWPNAVASVAAAFRAAGVDPASAMTRVQHGKIRPNGVPLAIRVSCGELTADDAIVELRTAGMAA